MLILLWSSRSTRHGPTLACATPLIRGPAGRGEGSAASQLSDAESLDSQMSRGRCCVASHACSLAPPATFCPGWYRWPLPVRVQDMVDAEKAAKSGKKVKKRKKKKKKKKKGGKKGKKKKDLTADRALEHLYVEMVSNGILQQPLKVPPPFCRLATLMRPCCGLRRHLLLSHRFVCSCSGLMHVGATSCLVLCQGGIMRFRHCWEAGVWSFGPWWDVRVGVVMGLRSNA